MATNDGGPAFPTLTIQQHQSREKDAYGVPVMTLRIVGENVGGMTLRDYFAGQAMGGLLGSQATIRRLERIGDECGTGDTEEAATWAYQMADAMLAARQR
jgi:hypothetical protein